VRPFSFKLKEWNREVSIHAPARGATFLETLSCP
jgi:hypothetical protein